MRVLIVEDDDAIATPLARGLEREGFDVERVETGAAALVAAATESALDVMLLDLGLPDRDGFDVCRELRAKSDIPIIVVTARSEEVDRVVGLELGADDYIVKPFGFRELVARIRAVAPTHGPSADVATVGHGARRSRHRPAHPSRHWWRGTRSRSRPRSSICSRSWPRTRARCVAASEMLEEVWDPHWYGPTKTLDVHVASLRQEARRPGMDRDRARRRLPTPDPERRLAMTRRDLPWSALHVFGVADPRALDELREREALEDLAGLVGHPDPDLLQHAVTLAVVVLAHQRGERAVDRGEDVGERDLLGRAGEHVAAADAALRAHEAGALHREQDLLEVGLGETGALGDLLHRRRPLRAVQRERQQARAA